MTNEILANVSRETLDALRSYVDLVEKWSKAINLVSRADLPKIWERHILDSIQICQNAPQAGHWVDLGSGGGFPGVVAAILSKAEGSQHLFTYVESDQRKGAFLRTAIREFGLNASVISSRIEDVAPMGADIVSARALADLDTLLGYAELHLSADGLALFPKGERWQSEQLAAQNRWQFDMEVVGSQTKSAAVILKIKDIKRV